MVSTTRPTIVNPRWTMSCQSVFKWVDCKALYVHCPITPCKCDTTDLRIMFAVNWLTDNVCSQLTANIIRGAIDCKHYPWVNWLQTLSVSQLTENIICESIDCKHYPLSQLTANIIRESIDCKSVSHYPQTLSVSQLTDLRIMFAVNWRITNNVCSQLTYYG